MNTLFESISKNTLIDGVQLISEKIFINRPIYENIFEEVVNAEAINIINGLETFIYLHKRKDVSYECYEIFEGVTGTMIGYAPVGIKGKCEAKEEAIKKATELLYRLENEGILVSTLKKISSTLTGVSPRYEGSFNEKVIQPSQLNIGDNIRLVKLRGGLNIYTATVVDINPFGETNSTYTNYKINYNENYNSYLHIPKEGFTHRLQEPQFIEIIRNHANEFNTTCNKDYDAPNEKTINKNEVEKIIDPSNSNNFIKGNNELECILKKYLKDSGITECKYNKFINDLCNNSNSIKEKPVPEALIEIDILLKDKGYIRASYLMVTGVNYHIVYYKQLDDYKKLFRLQINNIITESGTKIKYRIGIMAPNRSEDDVEKGELSNLVSTVNQISAIVDKSSDKSTEFKKSELIESNSSDEKNLLSIDNKKSTEKSSVTINKINSDNSKQTLSNIEDIAKKSKKEAITLYAITSESIEKLNNKTKKKTNIVEGQMTLFSM